MLRARAVGRSENPGGRGFACITAEIWRGRKQTPPSSTDGSSPKGLQAGVTDFRAD